MESRDQKKWHGSQSFLQSIGSRFSVRSGIWSLAVYAMPFFVALPAGLAMDISPTPGPGSFNFTHNGKTLPTYYYRPDVVTPSTPVWFIMHGVGRTASSYRDAFIDAAESQDALVIAPRFSEEEWFYYGLGTVANGSSATIQKPKEEWAFSYIEPLFSHVKNDLGLNAEKYNMYGHSAGGQFVHRFVEWMPEANVNVAVAANAGWYTMAQYANGAYSHDWPHSLEDVPPSPEGPGPGPGEPVFPESQLETAFSKNLIVLLGDDDISTDINNATGSVAQGSNRLERGQFFFNQAKAEAASRGVPFNWDMKFVQGVGHSNRGMANPAASIFRFAESPVPGATTDFQFNENAGTQLRHVLDSAGTASWSSDIPGVVTDGSGALQVEYDPSNPGSNDSTVSLPTGLVVDGVNVKFARMIVDVEPWNFEGDVSEELRIGFGHNSVNNPIAQVALQRNGVDGVEIRARSVGGDAEQMSYESLCNDQDSAACGDSTTDPLRITIDLDKIGNRYEVRYQHGDRPEYILFNGKVDSNQIANVLRLGFRNSFDEPGEHFAISRYQVLANPELAGDFDFDGDVDGNDFSLWESHFGTTGNASLAEGDADRDGDVDGNDFLTWQRNYGTNASAIGSLNRVPEPHAAVLLLLHTIGLTYLNFERRFQLRR